MKIVTKIFLSLLYLGFCLPSAYSSVGQKLKASGYDIHVFAEQKRDRLKVHGQITGGTRCDRLLLYMVCSNRDGQESVTAIVKNIIGSGARLFSTEKHTNYTGNEDWEISEIYVWCGTGIQISIYGKGDKISDSLNLEKGFYLFRLLHNGEENFSISLIDKKAKPVKSVVNTFGKLEISKLIHVEEKDTYFLEIFADQNAMWSIYIDYTGKKRNDSIHQKKSSDIIEPSIVKPKGKISPLPAAKKKPIKIYEDEEGVIHIEQ